MIAADAKTIAVSAVEAMLTLTNNGTATEPGIFGAVPDKSSTLQEVSDSIAACLRRFPS